MDEEIMLQAMMSGTVEITVSKQGYEDAKAGGYLAEYLDVQLSDLDPDILLVEPDGTELDPWD